MVTICNSFQIPFDGSRHREAQMGLEWGHQTKREATETTEGWNVSILWQKRQKKDKKGYLLLVPRRFQVCVCAPLFQMLYDTYVKVELITVLPCFSMRFVIAYLKRFTIRFIKTFWTSIFLLSWTLISSPISVYIFSWINQYLCRMCLYHGSL